MTPASLPILLIGLLVGWYWARVVQKATRAKRRYGRAGNLVPREPLGRWLRLIWVPAVVGWVAIPLVAGLSRRPPGPLHPLAVPGPVAGGLMVLVAAASVVLTEIAWKTMGRAWRMGIAPGEKTPLISAGPFAAIRHPIYVLSITLAACTAAAWPTPPLLACLAVHCGLIIWEALREERHLLDVHGPAYADYMRRTGRFVPRLGSSARRLER